MRKILFIVLLAALVLCSQSVFADDAMIYGSGSGITRAEWLHDLVVMFNMRIEEGNGPEDYFHDVDSTHSYYEDILKAVEFGVVDILAGGDVLPDDKLTRIFDVSTLTYCLGYKIDTYNSYTFSDVSSVTDPDAVQLALNKGWFSTVSGAFQPDRVVTGDEIRGIESSVKRFLPHQKSI